MQIVIDIPEKEYKTICEKNYVAVCACPNMISNAIKNGTPLPKGHGWLIDANMFMEYCQNQKIRTVDCNDIARFPTIVEVDKEDK